MTVFPFTTETSPLPNIGLIVLQTDETIEQEFRRIFPSDRVKLFVSRIPSGAEVTRETLAEMSNALPQAAALLPDIDFDAIAYCCTSGASVIGPEKIAELTKSTAKTKNVTDPVSALVHSCETSNLTRLAFLSPYIETVSQTLRDVLNTQNISTPVFGSFNEADDATVAKIDTGSLRNAALSLTKGAEVDGLFMSCTNLKTLDLIGPLQAETGIPVLSSNIALAHHLSALTGVPITLS